jgi:hypothetical protein
MTKESAVPLTNVFNRISALSDWHYRMTQREADALKAWILERRASPSEAEGEAKMPEEMLHQLLIALDYWMPDETLLAAEDKDQWYHDSALRDKLNAALAV